MELNVAYKSFFALLQAGLWSREVVCDCFPLTSEAWKQVYMLARKQTVEGIVYDGITQLPEHYFPPRDLLLKWVVVVDSIEERNRQMNRVAGELFELFTNNHITALMMKGQGVAACYDNPLHRVCGDIDWFFPDRQDFDKASGLILAKGIKVEKQAKFSKYYTWRGFTIEHHSRLIDIDNPFRAPYLHRLWIREHEHSIRLNLHEQSILLPSPLLMHLSVNAHILKHLLTSGVGIRQLCDSARLYAAYHHRIEAGTLKEIYSKSGIYRWIQLLNNLLVKHLGMPATYLPFPLAPRQNADRMMEDILQSGNFGFYGGPISKSTDAPQMRKKVVNHWIERLIRYVRYVRYAPSEACWNPVVVAYSHLENWLKR